MFDSLARCHVLSLLLGSLALTVLAPRAVAITVDINVPTASALEGFPGALDFTVKNVSSNNVRVSVQDPGVDYFSGDKNDEAFNPRLVPGGCPFPLAPQGTCTFTDVFSTQDLLPSESGNNVGIWLIANEVLLDTGENPLALGLAEVRDPAAVSTFPEPASWILSTSGLFALLVLDFFRRCRWGSRDCPRNVRHHSCRSCGRWTPPIPASASGLSVTFSAQMIFYSNTVECNIGGLTVNGPTAATVTSVLSQTSTPISPNNPYAIDVGVQMTAANPSNSFQVREMSWTVNYPGQTTLP